jgi:nucleotide-binding universal stress UspA family protein
LSSFSDACFRSTRAIAQLADRCKVRLTIAHITKPEANTIQTRRELDSFFAEADHYDCCRRVLVESDDPIKGASQLCEAERFDLMVAPASDRFGIHSFLTPSFRARLVKVCNAPLWTAGSCLDGVDFKHGIRNVSCLIDFTADTNNYLPLAANFADRLGAQLRVLHVVAPIDEGTLARSFDSDAPLMPDVAIGKIRAAFGGWNCPPIEVAVGDVSKELPKLVKRCDSDLVFVGTGRALNGSWMPRLSTYVDRLPCPVICVDGAASHFDSWSFQHHRPVSDVSGTMGKGEHALAS